MKTKFKKERRQWARKREHKVCEAEETNKQERGQRVRETDKTKC